MKKEKQKEQKVHRHSLTYTYEQTSEKNGERMKAESVESQRNINSSMEREASERASGEGHRGLGFHSRYVCDPLISDDHLLACAK